MSIGDFFSSIILKHGCAICSNEHYNPSYSICNKCYEKLIPIGNNVCEICGKYCKRSLCEYCQTNKYYFDYARSVFYYNDIASLIVKKFKYSAQRSLGVFMANTMYALIMNDAKLQETEYLTYVPFNYIKKYNRYYNHSKLLCLLISELTGIKVLHNIVKANTLFISQAKLPTFLRKKRKSLFVKTNYRINTKSVLIIDDVFTTGKTLSDMAKAIKLSNKDIKVMALTFARG